MGKVVGGPSSKYASESRWLIQPIPSESGRRFALYSMYNIKPGRAGGRMRCPPVGIHREISGETFRSEFDAIYSTGKTRGSSITTARTIMGGRRVKQPMNFTERRFTSIERRFLSLNVWNIFRILGEEIIIRTSLVDFSNFIRK